MTNLEIIETLKMSTFTDEDGGNYQLEFQDGLTDSEIEKLKQQFPSENIPAELIETLKETRGWNGYGLERVYFDSIDEFGFEKLSTNSLTLGHDGFGNSWILDLDAAGNLGKVFFACHDPAVFVIHSQNLNEFLHHALTFFQNPGNSHLNNIHERTVMEVWDRRDRNVLCSSKVEFEKKNPAFKEFLEKMEGREWTVADLRNGKNKDGFAWGKFGPRQHIERHPTDLIWVIENKKRGLFSRLFGK